MVCLAEPWEDETSATDAAGNRAELAPLAFIADGTPPALTWERSEAAGKGKRSWRWLARLTWSEPDRKWTTWKWVARSNYLDRSETPPLTWSAVAGQPELALTARRPVRLAGAVETRLGAGETIRLRPTCRLRGERRPAENACCPLTATDRSGNGATWWLEVPLPPHRHLRRPGPGLPRSASRSPAGPRSLHPTPALYFTWGIRFR